LIPFIEDNPLAVCDTRTVEPSDLVLTDRIFPNNEYTLYLVKHSQKQRWHWLSKQTPSELTLMMMYDSKPGAARCEFLSQIKASNADINVQSVLMDLS
jgi:hypothetical protein